jgi:hypothetical protein
VILTIDVTVTGPDQVLTGSTAVNVTVPPAERPPPAEQPPQQDLTLRSRALGWGMR